MIFLTRTRFSGTRRRSVLAQDPSHASAYALLGRVVTQQRVRDIERGKIYFERAIELNPKHIDARSETLNPERVKFTL